MAIEKAFSLSNPNDYFSFFFHYKIGTEVLFTMYLGYDRIE